MRESSDRRRRLSGHGLIEVLVAAGIVTILLFAVHEFHSLAMGRGDAIEKDLASSGELRIAMARINREVREASSIFFPPDGERTVDGIGFVDLQGHAILFHAEGEGAARVLMRSDLNSSVSVPMLEDLHFFRVTLHRVKPGLERSCVTLHVSVVEDADGDAPKRRSQITRVQLRNHERPVPAL